MIPIWKMSGRLGNQMFQYAYLYAQMRDGIIPDVYVQDEKYFKRYADEVKAMYSQDVTRIDQVSIHVRRGDYVKNPFYVDLCKTDYYERAIALFPKDTEFLVFSDNIEFCKQQFRGSQFEFCEGLTDVEDMNLMASCKAHIIANSSFSWWGAYIGGGRTIAPIAWYSDKVERTFCPKEWERI